MSNKNILSFSIKLAQARVAICSTAVWNSSFSTLAGAISTVGSTTTLLSSPYDVTFDGYQNMYVADYNNHRIQKFSSGIHSILFGRIQLTVLSLGSNVGSTVAGFTIGSGSSRSELYCPTAIYVDPFGAMYILDSYNYRVLKWQNGEPLGTVIVGGRGSGTTFDKIARSLAMFVDSQYNIYVSEYANNRVTKWFNGNTTAGVLVLFIHHLFCFCYFFDNCSL